MLSFFVQNQLIATKLKKSKIGTVFNFLQLTFKNYWELTLIVFCFDVLFCFCHNSLNLLSDERKGRWCSSIGHWIKRVVGLGVLRKVRERSEQVFMKQIFRTSRVGFGRLFKVCECQQVLIARAMMSKLRLLLLDEVSANLDLSSKTKNFRTS